MKEELITFETAKLAKEKNFEIGVNQSYIIYKESYNYDDDPNHRESYKVNDIEINNHYHVNNYKGIDLSNELYEAYSAPTQSLLQKWLREVHGINIFMTFKPNIKKWDFIPYFMSMDGKEYIKYNSEYTKIYNERRFDTYEEALETGLQEALKLIEIVKEK
jgi:hypothetical protein